MALVSVHDIATLFLAFCGGVSALGVAITYIAKAVGWIRRPEIKQNDTLNDHEKRISKLEEKVDNDYNDIKVLQNEVKMMLEAVVAIMKHEIDGNHTEDLLNTQNKIEKYLINK